MRITIFKKVFLFLTVMVITTGGVLGQSMVENAQKVVKIKTKTIENGQLTEKEINIVVPQDEENPEAYIQQQLKKQGLESLGSFENTDIQIEQYEADYQFQSNEENRPMMGVMLNVNKQVEENNGVSNELTTVSISEVIPNSPALKAGLQNGDIIKAIDDKAVIDDSYILESIAEKNIGDEVNLLIEREGTPMNITVVLGNSNDFAQENHFNHNEEIRMHFGDAECTDMQKRFMRGESPFGRKNQSCCTKEEWDACCGTPQSKAVMGVTIKDAVNVEAVEVIKTNPEGGAAKAGISEGDLIWSLDKKATNNVDELIRLIAQYEPGDKVKVKFEQNGKIKTKKVTLGERQPAIDFAEKEARIAKAKKRYADKSQRENIKIIQLNEGDMEKLLKGEKLELNITKEGKDTDLMVLSMKEGATVNCPCFDVVITELDKTEEEVMMKNDKGLNFSEMNQLKVINLALYPNPNDGTFELDFSLDSNEDVQIRIVSLEGKEIYRNTVDQFNGRYKERIELKDISTGIYVMQIIQNNRMLTKKIVVE